MGSIELFSPQGAGPDHRRCLAPREPRRRKRHPGARDEPRRLRGIHFAAAPGDTGGRGDGSLKQFESRRRHSPRGSSPALCDNRVVGAASALQVRWNTEASGYTWKDMTAEGYFTNHEASAGKRSMARRCCWPEGPAPSRRGTRAGPGTAPPVPPAQPAPPCRHRGAGGLSDVEEELTPEQFCMRVVSGDLPAATLHLPLSLGFPVLRRAARLRTPGDGFLRGTRRCWLGSIRCTRFPAHRPTPSPTAHAMRLR